MKLYIKNKLISMGGSSKVYNENKEDFLIVKGKIFTFTRKKIIKDLNNKTLYKVRNKYWNFFTRSAYVYDANGKKIARIKTKPSLKSDFTILGTVDEYSINGKFFSLHCDIVRNEEIIGSIKREITLINDAFELECKNDEDAPFLVALVVAIDNIRDGR